MSKSLKAAIYETHGNPAEVLRIVEQPWPEPAPDEVVVKVAAAATQLWGKVTNTAQMLTLDKVNELTQPHWVCSGAGARRELGWEPRVRWAQGVAEAVKWYRAEGWL